MLSGHVKGKCSMTQVSHGKMGIYSSWGGKFHISMDIKHICSVLLNHLFLELSFLEIKIQTIFKNKSTNMHELLTHMDLHHSIA